MNDFDGPNPASPAKQKGDEAEALAAEYFAQHGYRILERNFRASQSETDEQTKAEIDLVVEKGNSLVFVEVRYRRSVGFGAPVETVGPRKQRRIVLAALLYATRHGLTNRRVMRFDVLSVVRTRNGPRVEHFEEAFDADVPSGGMYSWV